MQRPTPTPRTPAPQPEIPRSHFAAGLATDDRYSAIDLRLGRFSDGMERESGDLQRDHRGRFSEGQEQLDESRPEKHIRRRFSEGL
jgi:hypothetical protein